MAVPDWNSTNAAEVVGTPTLEGDSRLVIQLDVGELLLEIFDSGVRLLSRQQRRYDYGLLENEPNPHALNVETLDQQTIVIADQLKLEIEHLPFSVSFSEYGGDTILKSPDDGHFVRKHRVPPLAKTREGWLVSFALKSGEPVYGLGEKWSALNKRGQLIRSYNHDALGVNAEISYKNAPFCWSPEGWGVLVNTPAAVTHAVGYAQWSHRSYCCLIEDQHLDLFIFRGSKTDTGADIISRYTALTGRAPMPPSWSGGVILSKAYYANAQEILSVAQEVRDQGMPCDVITFDGRAWQDTQTRFAFEWDATRYPQPDKVMNELKRLGFKVCVWEYPLISVKHPWFKEFADKGWLLTDRRTGEAYEYEWDRQAFGDVLTPLPNSGIVDFTHPDAYAFWRDAHKPLFDLGVDMIKADFGEQLEDINMQAHNGDDGLTLHNAYAHLYNRCVFEAAERYSVSGAFLFSRTAWTGSQRYNSQWGGDPQADWEGMMANIRGGLSWGLTGAPFYATDVGGFYKDTRDDALYVRWAQAGIFSAHFRLHGIGAREPWSYSHQANDAVMLALKLRYQLQRYLRDTMHSATKTGMPVQRAMVLAFPEEKQAWSFENQFMFGEDILVAPCFDEQGYVEVYLPHGKWVHFTPNSNRSPGVFAGGQVYQLELALNEIAAFIREGTRIGLNGDSEITGQIAIDSDGEFAIERHWPASE